MYTLDTIEHDSICTSQLLSKEHYLGLHTGCENPGRGNAPIWVVTALRQFTDANITGTRRRHRPGMAMLSPAVPGDAMSRTRSRRRATLSAPHRNAIVPKYRGHDARSLMEE